LLKISNGWRGDLQGLAEEPGRTRAEIELMPFRRLTLRSRLLKLRRWGLRSLAKIACRSLRGSS